MAQKNSETQEIVEAIQDLTRVILALNEQTNNKSDIIRKLSAYSIPPSRIASLLGMKSKDVTSALAKAKKQVRSRNGSAKPIDEVIRNEQ